MVVFIPTGHHLPAWLLIGLALGLVLVSGVLVYDDVRPIYRLRVTETSDALDEGDPIVVADLSPTAEAAFENARDGGYTTRHEPAYLETFPLYEPVDVRVDGTIYELWATKHGFTGYSLILAVPLTLLAVVLGALGIRRYRRGRVVRSSA